jgi:K(+)-stimulated pyrophosphate-energized sodium pump
MQGLARFSHYLGILSFIVAWFIYIYVKKEPKGTDAAQEHEEMVHKGVISFLKREYFILVLLLFSLSILLRLSLNEWGTSISFMAGALCSIIGGFVGIIAATRGGSRAAEAAKRSGEPKSLTLTYLSGSVMGLAISGMGLLGMGLLFRYHGGDPDTAGYIYGFAMGASFIAVFYRLGGGIYNNAAAFAADLVGRVETGIPEKGSRNPAVIAVGVGNNVSNIAGMAADLFDSFVGAVIAAIAIGATLSITPEFYARFPLIKDIEPANIRLMYMAMPILVIMAGMLSSFIGIFSVSICQNRNPARVLRHTILVADGLFIIIVAIIIYNTGMPWGSFWAILSGLLCGIAISILTGYHASGPVIRRIAAQSKIGPATVIISGLAAGMLSACLPILLLCAATFIGYQTAGVYGIALTAVGMLSTAGAMITVYSCGPIADNAEVISEISGLDLETRKITANLGATGHTTTAIGKSFATGSAALTAFALFTAFAQVAGLDVINIKKPLVLVGLFVGSLVPIICSGLTITSVDKVASIIVEEVRRQFREIPGLLEGKEGAKPDPRKCVSVSATSALGKTFLPVLIAVLTPVVTAFLLGSETLGGMILGSTVMGLFLALIMVNGGTAWDNVKNYIEKGHVGGKGSTNHKAAIVGDTVGVPFKDSSGPAMNIIMKVIPVVSLIIAPIIPVVGYII